MSDLNKESGFYRTRIFDSDEEYDRFVGYVFDQFNGAGLNFSGYCLPFTLRVSRVLLAETEGLFEMREITEKDLEREKEIIASTRAWDRSTLRQEFQSRLPRRMRRESETG